MSFHRRSFYAAAAVAAGLSLAVCAAQGAPASGTEVRLREALRGTTLQLNDAQSQLAAAQASQAQEEQENADLKAKLAALAVQTDAAAKQAAEEKGAADKTIADFTAKTAELNKQVARLSQLVGIWKKAYAEVSQVAVAKEAARVKIAADAALLQRTLDDRESKNLELFKTASEILSRYEKFGLGDAIGAKEPFIGLSRVKLETLIQDYKDKLLKETAASS